MRNNSLSIVRNAFDYPNIGLPGRHGQSLRPYFDTDGDGDGDGGGDEGDDDGHSGGDDESGGEEGDDGNGQPRVAKPISFKDLNAEVMLPGMKKPVKLKDLADSLAERGRFQTGLATMGQIAKAFQQQQGRQQRQPNGQQRQPQRQPQGQQGQDPLAHLEAMDLVDGKTLAATLRQAQNGTVGPLMKLTAALVKEVRDLRSGVSDFRSQRAEQDFSVDVNGAIGSLQLPRLDGKPIEGEDVLRDLATDLFWSYDDESRKRLRGETFHGEVKKRFESYRKFFQNYEKTQMEASKRRMREQRFVRPGANSSGSKTGRPKLLSNREASALLFRGAQQDS